MANRTIMVSDEAYHRFSKMKKPGESFSKLIIRISDSKENDWSRFLGMWEGSATEARKRFKNVRKEMTDDVDRRQDVLTRHKRHN